MADQVPLSEMFIERVKAEFSFLEERGFSITAEGEHSVRYESRPGVFVDVFRDPNDKYLGFEVGLMNRPSDALTTAELARLMGQGRPKGTYAETLDEIRAGVRSLARLLSEHGGRALVGDSTIYADAMALRRDYTRGFTRGGT